MGELGGEARAASEPAPGVDVLVIDDSEIALELILGTLESSRLNVAGLPGPIGATRAVITQRVRVVVTDVNMPELTGNNLVALFRNNPRTAHVKVILVSDLPENELWQLGRRSGAHGVVQKRRIESDLVPMVRAMLKH